MRAAYTLLTISLLSLGMLSAPALAGDTLHNLSITLSDTTISQSVDAPVGGDYLLTVTNDSSAPRGIVMTGIDRAVSPFIRYTKVLQPGESQTFRWFLAPERHVAVRDLLSCQHAVRTCMAADTGSLSTTIVVVQPTSTPAASAAGPSTTCCCNQ